MLQLVLKKPSITSCISLGNYLTSQCLTQGAAIPSKWYRKWTSSPFSLPLEDAAYKVNIGGPFQSQRIFSLFSKAIYLTFLLCSALQWQTERRAGPLLGNFTVLFPDKFHRKSPTTVEARKPCTSVCKIVQAHASKQARYLLGNTCRMLKANFTNRYQVRMGGTFKLVRKGL